ncbi:MAG: hypothetical protein QW745_07460 [Thermoplasmata archaeon]
MFGILQSVRTEMAIKIRKNVAPENIRGSRRRKMNGYKMIGNRKWARY